MSTSESNAEDRLVDFKAVFAAELEQIKQRRAHALGEPAEQGGEKTPGDLVGLAFSGGGIRSATFGLGIIQGLTQAGLLKYVDYLSTVSGGGYIGSWLAAWIKREGDGWRESTGGQADGHDGPKSALENVERQLKPDRMEQQHVVRAKCAPQAVSSDKEPEPIYHLRAYSNYLSPRLGFLSADTWTLLAIWLRNFLLNLLVLVPAAMAVSLVPRLILWGYRASGGETSSTLVAVLMFGLLLGAFFRISRELARFQAQREQESNAERSGETGRRQRLNLWRLHSQILVPLLVATVLACWLFSFNVRFETPADAVPKISHDASMRLPRWLGIFELEWVDRATFARGKVPWPGCIPFVVIFGAFHGVVHAVAMARNVMRIPQENASRLRTAWLLACGFFSGAVGGLLFFLLLALILWRNADDLVALTTFGPPLALLVFVLAAMAEVGLLGRACLDEDAREWWSSLCAWLLIYAFVWTLVFAAALYGSALIVFVAAWAGKLTAGGVGGAGLLTSLAGALGGRSPQTGTAKSKKWLEILVQLVPWIFLVMFLSFISWFVGLIVEEDHVPRPRTLMPAAEAEARPDLPATEVTVTETTSVVPRQRSSLVTTRSYKYSESGGLRALMHDHFMYVCGTSLRWIVGTMAACVVLCWIAAWRVDVNVFSMHAMYCNRLVRAYLGASRRKCERWNQKQGGAASNCVGPDRSPNLITGFDQADDLPLDRLLIVPEDVAESRYEGPYHLINTALNLVSGSELAWQERKAASFVFTPKFCGSPLTGYRSSRGYGKHVSLGTAVAISGAAASPNAGYHSTSPAVTALMTIFNVRLGWWLGNPTHDSTWRRAGPRFGLAYLLTELFGLTNDKSWYVYLSDGGHFENLAVYELVRRRCRYIVVSDAGADPDFTFEDLGGLIQKCRTDFGVDIEIDVDQLRRKGTGKLSEWHVAIGRIRYDYVDETAPLGTLVYIKPSLTGDEPTDVQHYAEQHPEFPHQPTVDQFFDESQFESYRALGYHVATQVFSKEVLGQTKS